MILLSLAPHRAFAQLPLMPRPEDRTSMWWRDGFPGVVEDADWRRVVRTGRYWFMLDTDTLEVARIGPVTKPAGDLPGAKLSLALTVDGKTYRNRGGADWTRFGGPRLIESGRFLQRADVTSLTFAAEDGSRLNAEARLESAAWPDRLSLIFAARPGLRPIPAGEACFGRVGGGFGLDGGNRLDVAAEDAQVPAEFTLEFWVFVPNDFRAGKHAPWLVCKNAHEQADGNFGLILHADAVPDVRLNVGGGRENAVSVVAGRRHALRIGRWNHVAIGYAGEVLRLVVNGQLAVEKRVGKVRVPKPGGLAFGARQDGLAGFEFRGAVDQIRLYGQALELGQLRHSFHHPEAPLPNIKPLREWTFREDLAMSSEQPRDVWKDARLEISLTNELGELRSSSQPGQGADWHETALVLDPATFKAVPKPSPATVETSRPVHFEPAVGWHRINLDGIEPVPPPGGKSPSNDAMERVRFKLTNPTNTEQIARLMFEKTARGIRQRIGTPITGVTAVLRDRDGNPTGIPIQLSKNWHSHSEGGVYNGQWFHGITQVRLPAAAEVVLELAIAYGHWGGLPAATHSQLSLIGWGGNQRWDQSALGAWGESICFDPAQTQAQCTITDVRPMMVASMSENSPRFNWTNNVGGGDFFRFFDKSGERIPHGPVRATYHCQGPCLTEVTYAGAIGGGLRHSQTVSLARTDDIVRGIYRIRLDATEPAKFSRFVIFQIGADTYSSTGERKMAIGDESGLLREWKTQWGGDVYRTKPMVCTGRIPWASLHEAERRSGHERGAWANRGLVIREWNARLGGKDAQPWLAERGLNLRGGRTSSTLDVVPPPGVTRLEPGDFVEATIEHLIMPQFAGDYHGPNAALRAVLQQHENTWRPIEREAVRGERRVEVKVGQLLRLHPDIRLKIADGAAEFRLSGGIGYVPVTFTGLDSHAGWQLRVNGEIFDRSVHGADFWQTDFDPEAGTWSQTYNLPAANEARELRFSQR